MPINNDERAAALKGGYIQKQKLGEYIVLLYWEVWRTDAEIATNAGLRARYIIELCHISGRQEKKLAVDKLEDADLLFDHILREHAVSLAAEALGLFGPTTPGPSS